jgi:hypothetical protein
VDRELEEPAREIMDEALAEQGLGVAQKRDGSA